MSPRGYYTLFMLLALAVFLLVRRLTPRSPGYATLPRWQRAALAWAVLVGGAFGAKLGHSLGSGADWFDNATWIGDGKTVTTGLVGGYLLVELTKLALGIRVKTGDAFALPLALAMVVGRWGCFFNGCCFGTPTDLPWAVAFDDGVRRHPTQVYESLFHLAMAGVLLWLTWYDLLRYQRLKFYLIGYGSYRFLTEFIRPEPVWGIGLTFYQWVCLVMIVGLSMQWWFDRRLACAGDSLTSADERMSRPAAVAE